MEDKAKSTMLAEWFAAAMYNRYYDDPKNYSIYNNIGSSNTYNPHSMAEQAFQNDVPKDRLNARGFINRYWSNAVINQADGSWSDVTTIKNLIKLNAAIVFNPSSRYVLEKEFFAPEDFVAEHKEMNIPWSRFYNAGKEVVWLEQDTATVQVLFVESKQNPGTMIPFVYNDSYENSNGYKHVFTNPEHEWSIQIIQQPGETYRSDVTSQTTNTITASTKPKQPGIDYNEISKIIQNMGITPGMFDNL
jgi:hypothetical protein